MQKKIGCLTTFYNFSRAYSLTTVVESQLVSLVKHGYPTVLFVHDNFTDDHLVPKEVEIRKIVPRFHLKDYSANQPVESDFEEQAEKAYQAFKEGFKDIDVVIEHDLCFQGWFLPYAKAIHRLADETNIKWLHWTHSTPNSMPTGLKEPHSFRYRLPKNSKLVYLNHAGLIRAAESYGLFPKNVSIVHNPVDPRLYLSLDPLVRDLIDRYDLLSADFIQTYPVSGTRMIDGKKLPYVIDVFAGLKRQGKSVRLIICNAHSNAQREKDAIEQMYNYAAEKNISRSELIFTSMEDVPKYEHGVDRSVVSQLMNLSNLFVFPSESENCPLILLEAMMNKQILILNEHVKSMKELAGENALYFNFGSIDDKVEYHQGRQSFMDDVAKIIISEYSINRPLKAANRLKQNYNYDYIFKTQIEPLFFEK